MEDESTMIPQVVRDWIDAWNSHDGPRLGALYAEGANYEYVPTGLTAQGLEGVAGFAEEFVNNLVGGLAWELKSASRAGNRATAEWSFSGTNEGLVPGEGAAGKVFEVRGSTAFELEGEKIRRSSDYYDHATIMRQVGALPEVGAPPS
jgi:steroid delta-isomerase-like uncharacterized protein